MDARAASPAQCRGVGGLVHGLEPPTAQMADGSDGIVGAEFAVSFCLSPAIGNYRHGCRQGIGAVRPCANVGGHFGDGAVVSVGGGLGFSKTAAGQE